MPEWVRLLPHVNAALNATAFALICCGLLAIRRRREQLHKRFMLSAVAASTLFLTSYLIYHAHVGSVKFQGEGAVRIVYFTILVSHTVLAVVQVPLIATTVVLGLRDRRARHRKWAKITAPIWLYVSLTGVVVYGMLYWL